jgi:rhamnogalacturonan endolyase
MGELMILASVILLQATSQPVTLTDLGAKIVLANKVVSVTIDKATATIPDMRLGNSPNLAGRGGYFAVANSAGRDGWDVKNGQFRVIRNSPDLAEVSIEASIGGCTFDQHYILRKDDPGYYVFVKMARPSSLPPEKFGQVRWSFYLNPDLFDYQWSNDQQHGAIPDMQGAQQVQDATYRLKDGSVYTKYNLSDYVENHFVHGITGSKPGGYGAFVVMGSNEYLGAPTKQYITVHSGPIIHRFLHSGHFLPRGVAHPDLPDNWSKLCGPWFIYLNRGDSPKAMWSDAKSRANTERKRWPYAWMSDSLYPLRRSDVTGRIVIAGSKKSAAQALVVLTNPEVEWQLQILDYIF